MNAGEFVQLLNEILFTLLFIATVWQAARQPSRSSIETAALFGAVCGLFVIGPVGTVLGLTDTIVPGIVAVALLSSIPYLLARLTASFSDPPAWIAWLAAAVAIALVAVTLLTLPDVPQWLLLLAITWFTMAGAYTGLAFLREGTRSSGLTRRRMEAVALGSMLLMGAIVVVLFSSILGPASETATVIARLLAVGSGASFWVGFAPPLALRRWWQTPEIRRFLERASAVPRIASEREALAELEDGAAQALGAPHATIGLYDTAAGTLSYVSSDGSDFVTGTDEFIAGQAFTEQRAIFIEDAATQDPSNAATYRRTGASAVLAAPITAGDERIGVLCIYSARAPLFADDDLRLVTLLADQAAVVLESRRFSEEAASVRALEAATRLKDDFLSAAAHDLKTPLTILLGQAELLERFAARSPAAPTDLERVHRIADEARRLQRLVEELLDTSRIEQGQLVRDLEAGDIVALARDACDRHRAQGVGLTLEADAAVPAMIDRTRIVQLLDNLIGNARKYSGDGSTITVRVWLEGGEVRIAVRDTGIGIPPDDLPRLFERFYRGSNVADRRHDGMGLGLYICRGIAEQHGGRIWAEPMPEGGTTFHVALPAATSAGDTSGAATEAPPEADHAAASAEPATSAT